MREYLFRGKRANGDGEWVEGQLLIAFTGAPFISTMYDHILGMIEKYEIVEETVGQYTGYEIGGKKLFEGDIVKLDYEPAWDEEAGEYRYSQTVWGTIVFENGMFLFKEYRGVYNTNPHIERDLFVWQVHEMYEGTWLKNEPDRFVSRAKHAEIIGNIFDNPDLLEA